MRDNLKAGKSRFGRLDSEYLFRQPFGHSPAPRMGHARVAALVVDRSSVRGQFGYPRGAEYLEKGCPAVSELSAPAVVDGLQGFAVSAHPGHRLNDEVLVERRVGQPLHPVGEGALPQPVVFGDGSETGIHGVGCCKDSEPVERGGRGPQLIALLGDIAGIFLGSVESACMMGSLTEFVPCPDRQHFVGVLGFRAVWILETGPQTFVPAVELQVGIFSVMGISDIQFLAGIVEELVEGLLIARIVVVIDQTEDPVE